MASTSTEEFVQGLAVAKVPTVEEQNKLEVRVLSLVLAGSFFGSLVDPALYILGVRTSPLFTVAALSHASMAVAALFLVAALAMVPHLLALCFMPERLAFKRPRALACAAAAASAVLWLYLAVQALPLDAGPLAFIYARSSMGSAVISFLYALSLNAQQIRHLAEKYLP